MGLEIERKFIVNLNDVPKTNEQLAIKQGYLNTDPTRCVRVRIAGENGYLTIKGSNIGLTRVEYEYSIPKIDAEEMLQMCDRPIIEKTRCLIRHEGHLWEIDIFEGANQGLIIAEIELKSEDESFVRPDWIGEEVTQDYRYSNSSLSLRPYRDWIST